MVSMREPDADIAAFVSSKNNSARYGPRRQT
jgi:hypothetical protein